MLVCDEDDRDTVASNDRAMGSLKEQRSIATNYSKSFTQLFGAA
ncbi:MAG TPA: hypothetical protein V6D18_12450 [Thermosynechococcaceae cyanobacterium]